MAVVKVGIAVSLTGQFRMQGRQALAGLRAWVEEVNRAGGLAVDRKWADVELIHYDDGSLAEGARQATERLIREDRVDLLFGPYSSGLARAAADVAAECGQVLWNQGGAAEEIYQPVRRVVGILSGAREYLAALPELVKAGDESAGTFGIVRCSVGAFPRQVSEGLEGAAVGLGFNKVLHLEFPPERSEFDGLAAESVRANPDLLLVVGRIRHDLAMAQALASRWRREGRRPKATAVVAAGIDRFRAELGDDAEGFIGPSQWEPPSGESEGRLPCPYYGPTYYGPTAAQVMASLGRVAADAGLAVDYPMAQAYAAGLVAQRCLQEAGTPDQGLLWEAAGRLDFHTFFGRFRIDPMTGRQVGRSSYIIQWQRGAQGSGLAGGAEGRGAVALLTAGRRLAALRTSQGERVIGR